MSTPAATAKSPSPDWGKSTRPSTTWSSWPPQLAIEKNLPLLGICRGIQVLNIALGGTLYQDIPYPGAGEHLPHAQDGQGRQHPHRPVSRPAAACAASSAKPEIWVNGKHHQAVKAVAPGLVVAARARDGVIEAVEHPGQRYVTESSGIPRVRGGMTLFQENSSGPSCTLPVNCRKNVIHFLHECPYYACFPCRRGAPAVSDCAGF